MKSSDSICIFYDWSHVVSDCRKQSGRRSSYTPFVPGLCDAEADKQCSEWSLLSKLFYSI